MHANNENNAYDADTEKNLLASKPTANIVAEVNKFICEVEKTPRAFSNIQSDLHVTNMPTSNDGFIAEWNQNIEIETYNDDNDDINTIEKEANTDKYMSDAREQAKEC